MTATQWTRPVTLDRLAAGWRPHLLLTLLALALYLPTLGALPPMDRDETRFAQATAQMLESGDYVRIRFQDTARNKKPAGIHWLQAASVDLLSSPEARAIWAYRVPSALGAWIAVLLTFAVGARLFDRRAALLGALSLGGCLMLFVEAHLAKTDAVLLACVLAAQLALARLYMADRDGTPAGRGWAALFWIAQGLAFLVKGPIALMVSGLTVAALALADRRLGWLSGLRVRWGLPLMLLIVLPWFVLAGQAFVADAVGKDLLPKLMAGQESHGAPPGYYLLLMTVFLFPASLFAWPALATAWKGWRDPGTRFVLAWLVPAWIVFELVPTKLPHYVLPLYPALALLTARAVLSDGLPRWATRAGIVLWSAVPLALGGAALALPFVYGDGFDPLSVIPFGLAMATLWLAGRPAWRGATLPGLRNALLGGAVLTSAVVALTLPRLDALDAAPAVTARLPHGHAPLAAAGYPEPSLVFLAGTRTRLVDGAAAAAHLEAGAGPALVNDRERAAFDAALTAPRAPAFEKRIFNYSRGRWETLALFATDGGR